MRVLLILVLMGLGAVARAECEGAVPCVLDGGRSYYVKVPDGWDGMTPLPVMLHFHGWGRQGTLIVKHTRISGATRRRGVLLVAPKGLGRSWDFWRAGSADVDFAKAVLADATRKYPIDWSNVFVSGYSYGAAMALRFGCDAGDGVRAILAVSGWIEAGTDCAEQPREVRHVHGLTDTVMPFPFGTDRAQGGPVSLWRQVFDCGESGDAGMWSNVPPLQFQRWDWYCVDGRRVVLDVHPSGHFIPKGWFARQLDELLGQEPRLP